ncbi:DMT family transporter [Hazenella sp. IB182353]|uniref:DMT family transporter n=1 Tax=Polycladospora coralii TaxID=2771432 RepID=UPI0017468FCB|nr:DMT family transporter [Polycladospora coralii]MBS7530861.1 DMT family transporter [Polycladospora coralii]
MGIIFAILSACTFAVNNVMIKKGIKQDANGDNGLFITVLMNVILLGLLCIVNILLRGWNPQFSWKAFIFFALAGLCTTGVGRLTLFSSISYIGPSKASAIRNTTPIFTTMFALLFLAEEVTLIPAIGMALLLGGILNEGFRLSNSTTAKHQQTQFSSSMDSKRYQNIGFGFALFAAFIFGVGQGIRKQGLIEMDDAFFGVWVGALASFIFVLLYQSARRELITNIKNNFTVVNPYFMIAGVLTSLGPLFFFLAAQTMQVTYVSVIAAAEPLITVFISTVIFSGLESISKYTWLSIALMFFGTVLISINV